MSKTQTLNTAEARHLATVIRSLGEDITNLQNSMSAKLGGTTFAGNAADVALGVMNEFKAKINDHHQRLIGYSNALDVMANTADDNEHATIAGLQVQG